MLNTGVGRWAAAGDEAMADRKADISTEERKCDAGRVGSAAFFAPNVATAGREVAKSAMPLRDRRALKPATSPRKVEIALKSEPVI
jgi:hypothetical protein